MCKPLTSRTRDRLLTNCHRPDDRVVAAICRVQSPSERRSNNQFYITNQEPCTDLRAHVHARVDARAASVPNETCEKSKRAGDICARLREAAARNITTNLAIRSPHIFGRSRAHDRGTSNRSMTLTLETSRSVLCTVHRTMCRNVNDDNCMPSALLAFLQL